MEGLAFDTAAHAVRQLWTGRPPHGKEPSLGPASQTCSLRKETEGEQVSKSPRSCYQTSQIGGLVNKG